MFLKAIEKKELISKTNRSDLNCDQGLLKHQNDDTYIFDNDKPGLVHCQILFVTKL
jgi:hypothetical protein